MVTCPEYVNFCPEYVNFSNSFCTESCRLSIKMSAAATTNHGMSVNPLVVKPPAHPTYDLKGVIKLALAEDAGDRGCIPLSLSLSLSLHLNDLGFLQMQGM